MAKQAKSISLNDTTIPMIGQFQSSNPDNQDFSAKVDEMLVVFSKMKRYTKMEIKNIFSIEEARLLYDICLDFIYVGDMPSKTVLTFKIQEAVDLDFFNIKLMATSKDLLIIIDKLSEFQIYTAMSNVYDVRKYVLGNESGISMVNELLQAVFSIE